MPTTRHQDIRVTVTVEVTPTLLAWGGHEFTVEHTLRREVDSTSLALVDHIGAAINHATSRVVAAAARSIETAGETP